jgi:hypothetical protein
VAAVMGAAATTATPAAAKEASATRVRGLRRAVGGEGAIKVVSGT